MKITFTKKSVKAINKWLKKCGFETRCVIEKGGEMQFDPNDNLIILPKDYDDEPDTLFMKCLRDLGLTSDFDTVTLSILHELGHSQTAPLFTRKEWIACSLQKMFIPGGEEGYFEYWKVKDELMANKWAVTYADFFGKKVQKLENIIGDYVKFG